MTRVGTACVAGLTALATAVAGHAVEALADDEPSLGPGLVTVELDIRHSRFSADRLRVAEGTTVRFLVRNDDPIAHELVVGDAALHRSHVRGTEAVHPPVPGEVSVGPGDTGLTVYEFDEPGVVTFACHLPRHLEYGMVGEVEVAPSSS